MNHVLTRILLVFIRIYQLLLSPFMGYQCRFRPTCSDYARDALILHGPWRGSLMAVWRIVRCNPWGGHGFEPVPGSCTQHAQDNDADGVDFTAKVGSKSAASPSNHS